MNYIIPIICVREDIPGATGPELVLTDAERAEVMEWLENDEAVYDRIAEAQASDGWDYD